MLVGEEGSVDYIVELVSNLDVQRSAGKGAEEGEKRAAPSERIILMSSGLGRVLPSMPLWTGEPPGVVAGDSKGVAIGVSQGELETLGRPPSEAEKEETAARKLADIVGG